MIEIPLDLSGKDLEDWLLHNSDSQKEERYFRTYDSTELARAREIHSDLSIKRADTELGFAEVRADYNENMKNQVKQIEANLKTIRQRGLEETGKVFIFRDNEKMTITTYNRFGTLLNMRSMTPDEKQLSIDEINPLRIAR